MYYLLDSSSRPRRWIDEAPYIEDVDWWNGSVITEPVPNPLEFTLEPHSVGSPDDNRYMGVFIETNPPVWRDDFVQALYDTGIQNFDPYAVTITDPDDGTVHTNYKAINILGLVAAADIEKSVTTVHDGIPLIDVGFAALVVDETKTRGIKMFRLAESSNAILVHESLRDALIHQGFGSDLVFYPLNEAAI